MVDFTVNAKNSTGGVLPGTPIITIGISGATAHTHTATLDPNSSVTVTVSLAGHFTYQNTFAYYELDPIIEIRLSQSTGAPHTLAFFQVIQEPCGCALHVYHAASAPLHSITWDWGTGSVTSTDLHAALCMGTGNFTLEETVTLYDEALGCGCGVGAPTVVDTDTYSANVVLVQSIPSVTLDLERTTGCPCSDQSQQCIAVDEPVTFSALVSWNNPLPPCTENTAVFTVTNLADNTFVSNALSWNPSSDPTPSQSAIDALMENNGNGQWETAQAGQYEATFTVTNCCTTVTRTIAFTVCDGIKITSANCNQITVSNCFTVPMLDVTCNVLDSEGVEIVSATDVSNGGSFTFTLPGDGVYVLQVKVPNSTEKDYAIVSYCGIKACLLALVQSAICKDCPCQCKDCSPDKVANILLRLQPMYLAFASGLTLALGSTPFYDDLWDNGLIEPFNTFQKAILAMKEYCDSLRCTSVLPVSAVRIYELPISKPCC